MIDFMLWVALLSSLATLLILAVHLWDTKRWHDWREEFDRTGIQMPLCEVLKGSEVVGYAEVGERRSRPR